MNVSRTTLLGSLLLLAFHGAAQAEDPLTIQKGDHVSLIGNVLAERMQHDGWLEVELQRRFPDREISVRNLGFSGDEIKNRLRSADFGSPDEWLARTQADVILAFFGFGESAAGEEGIAGFKKDLDAFITHTLSQKYDGENTPRLVLVSPIAFENRDDPNYSDGTAENARLEAYTKAMAEVADAREIPFVDLFHASREQYAKSETHLTQNGHYLTPEGNRFVASVIAKTLFPSAEPTVSDTGAIEKLRQAILDKNFQWFNRYRTVDGYNVYGGRSHLKYTDDLTNRVVMQREMEILDAMTANRDRRVWALAQGGDLVVDDSNTPEFIPVKTNMPGSLPDGSFAFLGGEEAISHMSVADGLKVELFASEEQFPELINPVQMAFDTRGRLWVGTWPSYPHARPKDKQDDRLLILEDTDGDGKADQCKTFADGLNSPTGFEFWNGGVLVAIAPDLYFLKDTDGDDVADVRERVLHGLDSADTHHTANSFVLAQDGALYFQEGTFHQSQIESVDGVHRNNDACVWRFEPRTGKVDRYVAYNFANPHGHVFDRWGQDFIHDGTTSEPYHATLFSGHMNYPQKHAKPPLVYDRRTRPCPATEILSGRHFPDSMQGNLLVGNVIGFQGILQYTFEDADSSFKAVEVEPIISSDDPSFRPVDLEMAPDGSLYFTDWQNPIVGHMQHHLRDPNRDQKHGRVYRITAKDRPLVEPAKVAGASIPELLDLLKSPEDRTRYRARIELSGRDSAEVVAAAKDWLAGLDTSDPEFPQLQTEALWVHQQHNVVNEPLLKAVLASPEPRARAAGVRVLTYWRDRLPDALETLKTMAADEHPRVRLEAVRAASFFTDPEATEIPLITLEHPTDPYLDFTREETLKTLDALLK